MHLYKYSAEDTSIVNHVMKSYFQRLIHAKYHIYVFLWLRTGNISLHLSVLLVVFESGYSHRKWNWFCDDSKWENQKDFLMSKKKEQRLDTFLWQTLPGQRQKSCKIFEKMKILLSIRVEAISCLSDYD